MLKLLDDRDRNREFLNMQGWWPWSRRWNLLRTDLECNVYCACMLSCSVVSNSLWPYDCSLPVSSVHGIFPSRKLEWVAISSSTGSSWPRDWTYVSCVAGIAGRFFTTEPVEKPRGHNSHLLIFDGHPCRRGFKVRLWGFTT